MAHRDLIWHLDHTCISPNNIWVNDLASSHFSSSDFYARGMCNPEQLYKVLFRFKMTLGYFQIFGRMTCCKVTLVLVFLQSLTFGHFYIRKSFPK